MQFYVIDSAIYLQLPVQTTLHSPHNANPSIVLHKENIFGLGNLSYSYWLQYSPVVNGQWSVSNHL